MMKLFNCISLAIYALIFVACEDYYDTNNDPVTYGDTYLNIDLNTDKAVYKPGETVNFSLKEKTGNSPKIRYSYLGQTLKEENLSATSWSWTAPSEDFKGYMIDIYEVVDGKEKIYQSIAVDVSSDWKKFPRYGFLSSYGKLTKNQIETNIDILNRYHINGIQFYDWMHDHQRPLAGTVDNPLASWTDLIGRTNYLFTVKEYISAAQNKGMKTMFYNLAFGALSNAASDGVREEWYIFKDANHSEKDNHHLDQPFRSNIYLTNPANAEWQSYLAGRNKDVYKVFNFDGYHIDQLGDRGIVYDYNGNVVKPDETYSSFITAMKQANPDKRLVMNAVSGYGQNNIAKSDVDFLYTEVWDESKTFEQLAQIILDNNTYSNHTKSTVLAAYMDYAKSNSTGYINAPGVLLANAVIFAFGGVHLELGEHYLANEYFPNSNLQMKTELKQALVHYYDFLVAYQNLLRDGGTFSTYIVQSTDEKLSFANWPASQGSVAVAGKKFTDRDVIHLINFTEVSSLEWRDRNGTQKEPDPVSNTEIKINVSKTVRNVWIASPDIDGGIARNINFTQAEAGNEILVMLPSLKYWDMIVIEY
jgi:dextranase